MLHSVSPTSCAADTSGLGRRASGAFEPLACALRGTSRAHTQPSSSPDFYRFAPDQALQRERVQLSCTNTCAHIARDPDRFHHSNDSHRCEASHARTRTTLLISIIHTAVYHPSASTLYALLAPLLAQLARGSAVAGALPDGGRVQGCPVDPRLRLLPCPAYHPLRRWRRCGSFTRRRRRRGAGRSPGDARRVVIASLRPSLQVGYDRSCDRIRKFHSLATLLVGSTAAAGGVGIGMSLQVGPNIQKSGRGFRSSPPPLSRISSILRLDA